MGVLDLERRTYEERRPDLVARARRKFVLIKGAELLGIFEAEHEGLAAAYARLGPRSSFFLHRIETAEEEEVVHLGIFSAGV